MPLFLFVENNGDKTFGAYNGASRPKVQSCVDSTQSTYQGLSIPRCCIRWKNAARPWLSPLSRCTPVWPTSSPTKRKGLKGGRRRKRANTTSWKLNLNTVFCKWVPFVVIIHHKCFWWGLFPSYFLPQAFKTVFQRHVLYGYKAIFCLLPSWIVYS